MVDAARDRAGPLARRFAALPSALRAGLWMSLSGAAFTGMMAIARHVATDIHVFEIVFWRALFGVVFMLPWVIRTGQRALHTRHFRFYALRALMGFTALYCVFTATTMMPLADIVAISFTRPIFATIAAILILREIAGGRRWSAILVGFVGALIVVRPGFAEFSPGVYLVTFSVALTALVAILVKYVSRFDAPDTMAMLTISCILPISALATAFVWTTPSWEQMAWFVLMGGLGTISQRAISRAYAAADATLVQVFDFTRLPIGAAIGYVFFAEVPSPYLWLGGAVIFASSIYIVRREAALARRAKDAAGAA